MKNLRKPRHPLLTSFQAMAKQAPSKWWDLEQRTRLDFCAQYLLLPVLKKGRGPTPEMLSQIMPSAIDIERQAGALLEEAPEGFSDIQDLVEKTVALFLLASDDLEA